MKELGEVLFLSRSDINNLLTFRDCFERCLETFRWVGEGRIEQVSPVNFWLSPPEGPYGRGVIQAFPARVKAINVAGIKWLSAYRENRRRGLPYLSAIDIISNTETGMPLAIIEGAIVTNMRTAGHAGVGAKYLAKENSTVIAIIGCGNQGRTHLEMMNELFSIEQVRTFDVIKEANEVFVSEMSKKLKLNIKSFDSAKEAVRDADIICMVTTSMSPVVKEEWLKPGCHVCATVGFMDLDPNCAVKFDKWVVGWYGRDLDWVDGEEVGKMGPKVFPYTRKNIYADLATELILGKKPGRERNEERTIMTHLGMPALDVAVAELVYQKAKEHNAGTLLKLF